MTPHPEDTIVALSSAPGAAARAVVRLSGPATRSILARILMLDTPVQPRQRISTAARLTGWTLTVPLDLLFWQAPASYTGQDLAELHLLGSPPIVDRLIAELLNAGARSALPGEFTLRAFLSGKKDLPQAEAVLGVIEAADADELKASLTQLAGGVTQPLRALREDLLNLLADVEAGLDFSEEDIQFVQETELLQRISKALAHFVLLEKQLRERSVCKRTYRVALVGEPNAGKSSLFNALIGRRSAIVSNKPGTTRDYLTATLEVDGTLIELSDTAGRESARNVIERQAQELGQAQAKRADLRLWCVPRAQIEANAFTPLDPGDDPLGVATMCDQGETIPGWLCTSAVTGHGIAALKQLLADRAKLHNRPSLAPSLSRCQHHVEACLKHLRSAHQIVLEGLPTELLALELRLTLDHLGEMVGAVYTTDLLDRIFSRFCIGK